MNLAAAILHDPDVVLLDEPSVGVDAQSRNAIFDTQPFSYLSPVRRAIISYEGAIWRGSRLPRWPCPVPS